MTFKKIVSAAMALCIMAVLGIALCGCDDLGEYDDVREYYDSFDDIIMINGTSREEYSVEDYFYNEDSREDFLEGDDGAYDGVEHSDYVYVAIPFKSDIEMDTFALYIHSQEDVAVYINVFVVDVDDIPSKWKKPSDHAVNPDGTDEQPEGDSGNQTEGGTGDQTGGRTGDQPEGGTGDQTGGGTGDQTGGGTGDQTQDEEKTYDDPDPDTRIGEITVFLKKDEWDSFVLDRFDVNGALQNSIQIKNGQCVLLQIRNNSGIRDYDEEKQIFVDPQTGLELQKAELTMTNLLIRALEIENVVEA